MAGENTTIGSVLVIPEGLLNDMEKVDKKLKSIQEKSEETAKTFNTSFKGMNDALVPLIPNIDKIVSGLTKAAEQSERMGKNMGGAVNGINSLNGSITSVSEMLNRLRTLVQTPTSGNGNFMSHVSTLMDAVSVRVSGLGAKFSDFKRQLLALDTAAMQQAMKSQSDAKVKLANEKAATTLAKVNLEQEKQNRLYAQAATEAAKLARAQAQLAQAQAMAATAQERATAANERAAKNATIRQYGASASSALSYVNDKANTGTYHQRAIAIKVLEDAIKNLNKTDADYQKNLGALSERYKQLKSEQDAVNNSMGKMHESHRKLMDTSGQLQRAFALVFSVSQIKGYIGQIAQVRGEFELQQRSLEAILQNKTKADEIFNKTVALAVQSPYQIKDLVSYTKQLAAYRIESDKLYDTTKRLADVSAGLGVDMQRIILAYGQVKAAAYLRGTEVRQFTEAGINLYGELQRYFQEVRGEAYTTAQIVDMISKRMVTFEDVEQVFKRLTDQGGIFYNMQAIQAETLQGKISNLKDSVDIMLNSIGKSNQGVFNWAIDGANTLLRNWEHIMDVGRAIIAVLVAIKLRSMAAGATMKMAFSSESAMKLAIELEQAKMNINGLSDRLNILWTRFKLLASSAKSAGIAIKGAFMANLPMIAVGLAVDGIIRMISHYNTIAEEKKELNRQYDEEIASLNVIIAKYRELEVASKSANNAQGSGLDAKSIKERRNVLQQLIDKAKDMGISNVAGIGNVNDMDAMTLSTEKLDDAIKMTIVSIQRAQKATVLFKDAYNDNKNSIRFWGLLGDNIDNDTEDLREMEDELITKTAKMNEILSYVGANYDKLSEKARGFYDSVKEGQDVAKGETEVEYLERLHDALNDIENITGGAMGENMRRMWIAVDFDWGGYKDNKNEFIHELEKMKRDLEAKGVKDPVAISAAIDRNAVDLEWSETQKHLAKKAFNVPLIFDPKKTEEQIKSIGQQIDDYFRNNDFTVKMKLDWSETDPKTGYKDYKKTAEEYVNEYVDWYNSIQEYNKARGRGNQWQNYDILNANRQLERVKKQLIELGAYELALSKVNKNNSSAQKTQRDILSEQIALLREMQSRYEDLLPLMGTGDAAKKVMQDYADSLKYVKMPESVSENLVPSKEGMVKALENLLPYVNDFKKKMELKNLIAEYNIRIKKESLKEEIDNAKRQIEDAFSGLDVFQDLTKAGLGEETIRNLFGDLPKTLEDVKKKIADVYAGKDGNDWMEANEDANKKLAEKEYKDRLDNINRLVKAYKDNLSEQLQLDNWYYSERLAIEKNITDSVLKEQMKRNLDKQYAQKKDLNTWNDFKESDMYIRIFENLDSTSTRVLEAMRDKLENLRGSLNNLSPEQLKQVVEQTEKVNEALTERNPFKALKENYQQMIEFSKGRNRLEMEWVASSNKQDYLKGQAEAQNATVNSAQRNYDLAKSIYGEWSEQAIKARQILDIERAKLDTILSELVAQGKITEELADQIRNGQKATETYKKGIAGIAQRAQVMLGAIRGAFSDIGLELSESMTGALDGLDGVLGGIQEFATAEDTFSKVVAGIKIAGAAAKTIGSIFGIENKDKKLEERIQSLQKDVESLQHAYDKLKEAMDDAWSTATLNQASGAAIANLRAQISKLNQMISAEYEKKKTDYDKITQYQQQIEANLDTIKELQSSLVEQVGGFGSEANFKSAAQQFADAWVDAYKEGSNALEALNQTFSDFVDNLIKKQVMMNVAEQIIRPILDSFDDLTSETVVSDPKAAAEIENQMKAEQQYLEKIKKLPFISKDAIKAQEEKVASLQQQLASMYDVVAKDLTPDQLLDWFYSGDFQEQLKQFDADASAWGEALNKIFGELGIGTSASLSKLQQGITSITETQASALESLLNSIRFFVAQQSADVTAIRNILASTSSIESQNADSPVLVELRTQTVYLGKIQNMLSSVIKMGGHPKSGAGLKVFVD